MFCSSLKVVLRSLNSLELNTSISITSLLKNVIKMPFYAVARGRTPGIFMSWADCEAQVKGFSGARYKKFDSAASAQGFIEAEGGGPSKSTTKTNNNKQNNLKRSYNFDKTPYKYSNNKNGNPQNNFSSKQRSATPERKSSDGFENSDSEGSDDLNVMLMKQMDDIEKRVNNFSKGVDKIVKKGSGSSSQKKAIFIEPPQPKKRKSGKSDFEIGSDGFVHVYTDGACSANGQRGARAGLGVYWADDHPLNASQAVSGRATNNCGEIQAATHAIKQALDNGITKLAINTDSQFLINSVTKWIPGWKRKGWKLKSGEPVKNEIDFKELDSLQDKLTVRWNYVEAHRGIHGNEMADQLAKAGAAMYKARH